MSVSEMMVIVSLLALVVGLALWVFRRQHLERNDLGSVSAQWLHEYRRETHEE